MSSACPSEEILASFFARKLSRQQQDDLEEHLDTCGSCRRAVAEMAVAFSQSATLREEPSEAEAEPSPLGLGPGAQVGRYVILRPIGRGGMGVVYAALDPSLERTVAVKLLGRNLDDAAARARLLDEAKVMAKVAHPNVVAVHDVGFFESHPFVAMERVEGETLRARLGRPAARADRRAMLATLLAAGEGLAAIHEAGLVHRDFKPENVLCGDDGRVRVVDFGLATAMPEGPSDAGRAADPERAGIAGTPAYMSPEQRRGERVDARADQYAFAVTAWEALFGARPFDAEPGRRASRGPSRRPAAPPGVRRAERELARALSRALEAEPSARFASLRELLDAMQPRRARWQSAAALAAVALLASGAAAGVFRSPPGAASCDAARIADETGWGARPRERVRAALEATTTRYGAGTAPSVLRGLDAYVARWVEERVAACELGRRADSAAPSMAALRTQCLDERLRDFDALVAVVSEPSSDLLLRAPRAVAELAPIEACAEDAALLQRLPAPPADRRDAIANARDALRHGSALAAAGRYTEAEDVLEGISAPVERLGYEPLVAEWALARGALSQSMVGGARTEELLRRATFVAEASRHDAVATEAWIRYARYLAWQGQRFDRAELAIERAQAALLRTGGGERQGLRIRRIQAFLDMGYGKLGSALDRLRSLARDQRERLGDGDIDLVDTHLEHARASMLQGLYSEAYEAAAAGVRVAERTLGPDHPETAGLRHFHGSAALRLGELDVAHAELERARAILEDAYGAEHTKVDFVLADLARLASVEGSHEAAVALAQKGVDIDVHSFGESGLAVAFALVPLADVLLAAGRFSDAARAAERASRIWRAVMPPDHYLAIESDALLAAARSLAGDPAAAREPAEHARSHYAERGGPAERRAEAALALSLARARAGDARGAAELAAEATRALEPLGAYGAALAALVPKAPGAAPTR